MLKMLKNISNNWFMLSSAGICGGSIVSYYNHKPYPPLSYTKKIKINKILFFLFMYLGK